MSIIGSALFLPTPYQTAGRQGSQITDIVLHWMAGTLAATDAEFAHGSREVSANYGVEESTVHNYVKDSNTAWHCGNWEENCRSIGIEISADPKRPASALTIATSTSLIVELCRAHPIDLSHIYPHNKFFNTACPGTIPLSAIVVAVRAQLGQPTNQPPVQVKPTPPPMLFVHADVYNVQHAASATQDGMWGPGTDKNAMCLRAAAMGQSFNVVQLQTIVGAVRDGLYGPNSKAATRAHILMMQGAVHVATDGGWGPITDKAFTTIRYMFLNKF